MTPPDHHRAAGTGPRLSEVPAGRRAVIAWAEGEPARRRMLLYGLADGIEIEVERRGHGGDLIVRFETVRLHIPVALARSIRLRPPTPPGP